MEIRSYIFLTIKSEEMWHTEKLVLRKRWSLQNFKQKTKVRCEKKQIVKGLEYYNCSQVPTVN